MTGKSEYNYNNEPGNIDELAYNSDIPVQRLWQRKRVGWILSNLPKNGGTVLDVGCGSGVISRMYAKCSKNVFACDVSKNAVEYASERAKEEGLRNIKFAVCSAYKLPYKDNQFDTVIAGEIIEHVTDAKAFISEIRRVLKKDGNIIITTPNYLSLWPIAEYLWSKFGRRNVLHQHVTKFNVFSIKRFLIKNGFHVEKAETLFLFSPFLTAIVGRFSEVFYDFDRLILKFLRLGMGLVVLAKLTDK